MCIDSSINQEFTFTPSTSLFVACDTATEIGRLFEQLSQDGRVECCFLKRRSVTSLVG